MTYAGFFHRFIAAWVDVFVLLPLLVLNAFLVTGPKPAAIASYILVSCAAWLYTVYCHARWGQTVGKMVTKIRVVRISGERIDSREALLRSSVDGVLTVLAMVAAAIAVPQIPDAQYRAAGWMERNQLIQTATPAALAWVSHAMAIWSWGELLTLLCNRKRRALHDFIAGTVVVQTDQVVPSKEPEAVTTCPA